MRYFAANVNRKKFTMILQALPGPCADNAMLGRPRAAERAAGRSAKRDGFDPTIRYLPRVETALVLGLLVVAVALFVTERLAVETVALLILCTLVVLSVLGPGFGFIDPARWISLNECLSGFSHIAVITVGAMFVLSAGLQRTGTVAELGRWLSRLSESPNLMLLVLMLSVASVSAFVNNTAAVAVLLPAVLTMCARHRLSSSKFLIPLSYAAQLGGVCTLIGTSTNLVVNSIAREAGLGEFRMFEFGRLGLIMVGAGTLFMWIAGRWLLPSRRGLELTDAYQLREYITELRVARGSPFIGRTVRDTRLGEVHDITVLELLRSEGRTLFPMNDPLREGDILMVRGRVKALLELRAKTGLEIEPEFKLKDDTLQDKELALVEALVAPRSRLVGRSFSEVDFRWRYQAIVLAMQRQGSVLREKMNQVRLRFGDALLMLVRRQDIPKLHVNENLIVLGEVGVSMTHNRRAVVALTILAGVVAVAAAGLVPILVSALLGAVAMILTRCLTVEQAVEAVDWRVILLLAGTLPLGLALQRSGAAELIAHGALELVGNLGPIAALAMLYLLTAVLTEFMSNNAAAVLLAPIGISTAAQLGVDAKPFLIAVAFAASTSFATPVGYQTNSMVYNAGGYRFADFLKVGTPLNFLLWGLSVFFIPRFWPF